MSAAQCEVVRPARRLPGVAVLERLIPARLRTAVHLAGLLAVFVLLDHLMDAAGRLSTGQYARPFLVLELLHRAGPLWLTALVSATALVLWRGSLASRWEALAQGRTLRWFVVVLAAAMAWSFSTLGYNHYFDQGYYLDRALIVVLVPLLWWRPAFVFAFLPLAFALMWQIAAPGLGGSVFAHKLQVLQVLNLFAAAFAIHAVTGVRRTDAFVFLACCLVAGSYWVAALAKLEIDWPSYGHLYRMPLAAYAHGWLAFLEPATVVEFARTLAWFDWPMRAFVIALEAGCVLFLWRRRVSIALLAAAIAFHAGVFALYGFLFWTWMLLDLALLVVLVRDLRVQRFAIYTRHGFLASLVLIAAASVWSRPPRLGWLDTSVSYVYRLDAVGESGRRYALPPGYFSPYDDNFTMASFSYLVTDHAVLVSPYGVTRDRRLADALAGPVDRERIFALERTSSRARHDPARSAAFAAFVQRFVANRNRAGSSAPALSWLQPPPQFWSFTRGEVYTGGEPIAAVIVREETRLFDGEALRLIRDQEIDRLPVPAAAPGHR